MRFRSSIGTLTFVCASSLALLSGCASGTSFVKSDTTLGRVVVYRNGVAYYERYARVDGGELKLSVPADKVDDFLKSLTVVDAHSGKPAPVSYPTSGTSADADGLVRMAIQVPKNAPHDLKLSYVTEAPSWKPSYRITLGKNGKVDFQGWAIVDNTSGEDWTNVKLGVGSSSALSFRFDLRSVRLVERETLRSDLPFAMAPPTGESTYADGSPKTTTVLGEIGDNELNLALHEEDERKEGKRLTTESKPTVARNGDDQRGSGKKGDPAAPPPKSGGRGARGNAEGQGFGGIAGGATGVVGHASSGAAADPVTLLTNQLKNNNNKVVVEGFAGKEDGDKNSASLERANRLREQLIQNGISPDRVVAVGSGEKAGRGAGVRIVQPPPETTGSAYAANLPKDASEKQAETSSSLSPIDTSHFESQTPMTVARGTSAMVSIYSGQTEGEVVYLYDPETPRGNGSFPFKSVRIQNPTDSALESGPVTVFGEGRFIGEGLSDAIPPKSAAFVPYALDRQIVVEKKEADRDEIARVITVQRGVFSTETKHIKKTSLTMTNRLHEKATVYVRHTLAEGYKLTKSPEHVERLGGAHLFRIEIEPGAKVDVEIEEATPILRSTDIRSAEGMDQIKAYVSSAALDERLKSQVGDLVKLEEDRGNLEQRISTLHEQMGEYRARMDELHAQLVTLKAVKTAGPLMKSLETKLSEVSDKVSKATVDVVGLEEQLMLAKVKFQDKVAELSLDPDGKKKGDDKDKKPAVASKP